MTTTTATIEVAKSEYIIASTALTQAYNNYMTAARTRRTSRPERNALDTATSRIIASTAKLHNACNNCPVLIAEITAEIEAAVGTGK